MDSVVRKPKGSRTLNAHRRQLSSQHRIKHNNYHLEDSAVGPLHRSGDALDLDESKDNLNIGREGGGIGAIAGESTNERLYEDRKSNQYFNEHHMGMLN